ncbi:MAG: hypothetical protein GY842_10115 [bacterium]|nr:hypothetical protein [bacterium]
MRYQSLCLTTIVSLILLGGCKPDSAPPAENDHPAKSAPTPKATPEDNQDPAADPHAGHNHGEESPTDDAHSGHDHGEAEHTDDPHAGHDHGDEAPAADPHAGHDHGDDAHAEDAVAVDPHAGHDHGDEAHDEAHDEDADAADPHAGHGKAYPLGTIESGEYKVSVVQFGLAKDGIVDMAFEVASGGQRHPDAVRAVVRTSSGDESIKAKAEQSTEHRYHLHIAELPAELPPATMLVLELENEGETTVIEFRMQRD